MKVGLIQLTAGADREANLARAEALVGRASEQGAQLVVLPELFSLLGRGADMRGGAEPLDGPTSTWAVSLARRLGIWLVAGSFAERATTHASDGRYHNTSTLLSPAGDRVATYRKIHLFDNEVPGAAYHESEHVVAGDQIVTASIEVDDQPVVIGMSTCYDLRFPELFRALINAGADVIVLPSAFTEVTGQAHWEPLIRARAIENQCFVVAANQVGVTGAGIECHGRSMVVDPWGQVLTELDGDHEDVAVADIDLEEITRVRTKLPALEHRRPDLY